jgi:uncharacterized phage protein gp47/JayE
MPIQKPKSAFSYQSEILAALMQTGIRQTSPGGKARAFCDIVGAKLGDLETNQYINISQTLLPYAVGENLDLIGEIFGIRRIQRVDVDATTADSTFRFYVRRGDFGGINSGSNILIPAGTRIFTDSDTGPIYVTTEAVTLSSSASSAFVPAQSTAAGSSGNAAAGVFTRHNFTNYTDSRFGALLVSNSEALVGGRDAEDDESYRYRINLKLQSKGGSAEGDLRLAVLQIPGVQDVEFEREAGTYNAYVYGVAPNVPASLLQLVQEQLDQRTAYPLVGMAIVPDLVGISLYTKVKISSTTSASDKAGILSVAVRAAEDYINNLRVGQTIVINEIADQIMSSDARIIDIGDPNRPLQEIFIWRARLDGSRYSRFLVANYTPVMGERIVVENRDVAINLETA